MGVRLRELVGAWHLGVIQKMPDFRRQQVSPSLIKPPPKTMAVGLVMRPEIADRSVTAHSMTAAVATAQRS